MNKNYINTSSTLVSAMILLSSSCIISGCSTLGSLDLDLNMQSTPLNRRAPAANPSSADLSEEKSSQTKQAKASVKRADKDFDVYQHYQSQAVGESNKTQHKKHRPVLNIKELNESMDKHAKANISQNTPPKIDDTSNLAEIINYNKQQQAQGKSDGERSNIKNENPPAVVNSSIFGTADKVQTNDTGPKAAPILSVPLIDKKLVKTKSTLPEPVVAAKLVKTISILSEPVVGTKLVKTISILPEPVVDKKPVKAAPILSEPVVDKTLVKEEPILSVSVVDENIVKKKPVLSMMAMDANAPLKKQPNMKKDANPAAVKLSPVSLAINSGEVIQSSNKPAVQFLSLPVDKVLQNEHQLPALALPPIRNITITDISKRGSVKVDSKPQDAKGDTWVNRLSEKVTKYTASIAAYYHTIKEKILAFFSSF